jgi:putative peptidoglycan lipid II flippase
VSRLAEEPGAVTDRSRTSARSARLVAAGILLSRLAGFIREAVLARYLGTSPFASAFRAGLRLPNVIQNLLGEGTLSASFIPVYVRLLERGDRREAGRLAGAILSLLFIVVGSLSLLGSALAPILVRIAAPGFNDQVRDATIRCARILFPMTGVLTLSAWALGILNSHRRFFVSYSAPVVWNAAIIGTLVTVAGRALGADFVVAVSWGALIGGFAQFAVQLPWVLRLERSLDLRPDYRMPEVREVLHNAGPAILGRGAVQLSAYVDVFLASFLFTGAVAALNYAQTLYVLPVSLFGMSVAAAELPELAREGSSTAVLNARLSTGLGRIAFFVVPSAVGFLVLGDVIVGALFERGRFTRADTLLVSMILVGYSIGLLASTRARLFASTFYALGDTRTPARIAAFRVAVAGVVGVSLMFLLERHAVVARPFAIVAGPGPDGARPLGSVGLAVGAGVAAWIEWAALRKRLRGRLGASLESPFAGRMIGAALASAALARATDALLPAATEPLLRGVVVLPVFGLAYLALTRVLGVPTAAALLDRLRVTRRNGRG